MKDGGSWNDLSVVSSLPNLILDRARSSNGRTRRSDRRCVGSNPTLASNNWRPARPVVIANLQLESEVIRLDEELVLKTGDGQTFVGSSPTASA